MAHNFRLGAYNGWYVGKASTSGQYGTADNPFKELMGVFYQNPNPDVGSTSIVGTGTYLFPSVNERRVNSYYDRPWGTMNADGSVKLIGRSDEVTTISSRRCTWNSFYFEQALGYGFGYESCAYNGCTFKVLATSAGAPNSSGMGTIADSVLFNLNVPAGNGLYLVRCLLINCTFGDGTSLAGCYLDPTSAVSTAGSVTNCNVDPAADTDSGKGLQRIVAGTPGPWAKTGPGIVSVAPAFNSVPREDFTLQATSPHVALAIGPSQYRYSNSYYAEFSGGAGEPAGLANIRFRSSASNTVVPLVDITTGTNGFDVNNQSGLVLRPSPQSDGTGMFTTGRVPFADTNEEITVMLLKAGLNFNTSFPAQESAFNFNLPEVYNNNVPDFSTGEPGSAARNPNRLSYRMRWSTKGDPNPDLANAEDWLTGTKFIEFEWNQPPLWNPTTGIGNGEASFNASAAQAVICRCYQLQVQLRNNYYR